MTIYNESAVATRTLRAVVERIAERELKPSMLHHFSYRFRQNTKTKLTVFYRRRHATVEVYLPYDLQDAHAWEALAPLIGQQVAIGIARAIEKPRRYPRFCEPASHFEHYRELSDIRFVPRLSHRASWEGRLLWVIKQRRRARVRLAFCRRRLERLGWIERQLRMKLRRAGSTV